MWFSSFVIITYIIFDVIKIHLKVNRFVNVAIAWNKKTADPSEKKVTTK